MTPERTFRFHFQSRHAAPDRTSTDLAVQGLNAEGRSEPQDLGLTMPGFRSTVAESAVRGGETRHPAGDQRSG